MKGAIVNEVRESGLGVDLLVDTSAENIQRLKRAMATLPDNAIALIADDEVDRYSARSRRIQAADSSATVRITSNPPSAIFPRAQDTRTHVAPHAKRGGATVRFKRNLKGRRIAVLDGELHFLESVCGSLRTAVALGAIAVGAIASNHRWR